MFGRAKAVLARLVVPTTELLDVHSEVHRLCLPHLQPGPMANALPGQWTAHVTVARRVMPNQLGRAVRIAGKPPEMKGSVVGLAPLGRRIPSASIRSDGASIARPRKEGNPKRETAVVERNVE